MDLTRWPVSRTALTTADFNLPRITPGQWITIKLQGQKANRAAIGARLALKTSSPDGKSRILHRFISTGSSFGGNSLSQTISLASNEKIDDVTIRWPGSDKPQSVKNLPVDRVVKITEDKPEADVINLTN